MARRSTETNSKLIRIPQATYDHIIQAADRERRTIGAQVAVMVERAEKYQAAISGTPSR